MENLPPRPKGKQTRFFIDNEYIENGYLSGLPPWVFKVYSVLARHAFAADQTCYPSLSTISKKSGTNRNYATWATRILEALNMLQIEREDNEVNHYTLLDSKLWKPVTSINVDTYRTISKVSTHQYQKQYKSSINVDTRTHISNSYKEHSSIKSDTTRNDSIKNGQVNDFHLRKIRKILGSDVSDEECSRVLKKMKEDDIPLYKPLDPDVVRSYHQLVNPKPPSPAADPADSSNPE